MTSNKIKSLIGLRVITALILAASLILSVVGIAMAGPVGNAQGFEDDDGNLTVDSTFDWNGFAPVTWAPQPATTPTRQASGGANNFQFLGLEDWQATTSDSGFAGGTKQDDNCASVITAKADNKADLKRIYVASRNLNGEIYLDLAWVRIPQNTTSPSAHIAFEFNQGTTPCGAGSDGLVQRTAGDMLIVYDFEGGSTDTPHITLKRWVTSGACEISNDTAPCWGPGTDLTVLGYAEAKVNTFGNVTDNLAPPALNASSGASVSELLRTNEFGEAGINLGPNGANVFPANQCLSFGKVFGVSRTSGNSGTAQMKDLVGPGNFRLSNCGKITIIKQTNGRGVDQSFGYTTTGGLSPASFNLNDTGNAGKTLGSTAPADNSAGNTQTYNDVLAGTYSVTEGADPYGFVFESLTCTASGAGTSVTPSNKTATITLAGDGQVTCLYVNKQQLGAILVTKTRKHAADGPGNHPHPGVSFTVNGVTQSTDANGQVCFGGLSFGTYNVTETVPSGYVADGATTKSVTVDNNAQCNDNTYIGETVSFSNTPLTDLTVTINSQVDGGTASTISCVASDSTIVASGSTGANGDGSASAQGLKPDTYTCTILIDP